MPDTMKNPEAIAERGLQIYDSKYREIYEREYTGKFVAVGIEDESATIGDTGSEALLKANSHNPSGLFHLIRVGYPAAFEIGFAYRHAIPNRLHR